MSMSDITLSRRYRLLRHLRYLLAQIDDACARDDFEVARENSREVADLLAQVAPRAPRADPARVSGVQRRLSDEESAKSPRRAS
jgi:hypothetical protein